MEYNTQYSHHYCNLFLLSCYCESIAIEFTAVNGAASFNYCHGVAVERRFLKLHKWTSKLQQQVHGRASLESTPSSVHCTHPSSPLAQVRTQLNCLKICRIHTLPVCVAKTSSYSCHIIIDIESQFQIQIRI